MVEKFEYELKPGSGAIKKAMPFKKMSPVQQKIYKRIYDPVNGILEFINHCVYVNRNGIQQYKPFDYQKEMLFNIHNYDRAVALVSRQSGKTASSAAYINWFATVFPSKQILITSQDMRSANEILTTIKLMYEYCPNFVKRGFVKMNESELWFDNGSRIFSRASNNKAARGLSPALIYCDEFALVGTQDSPTKARGKQEEFFSSITPALSASHGKLNITSTPIAETDLFYSIWSGAIKKSDDKGIDIPRDYIIEINGKLYDDFHLFHTKEEGEAYLESIGNPEGYKLVPKDPAGVNGFQSLFATWDKCPFRTPEWAEKEVKVIGEEKFEREYNCLSPSNQMILQDDKGNIIKTSIENAYNFMMK